MKAYETLQVAPHGATLCITLHRPQALNALNQTVLTELADVFGETLHNAEVRSVLLTGSGEKAFVAGADIAEFPQLTEADTQAMSQRGHNLFHLIEHYPKPVVAAINGFALGGGLELAMACHFRLASDNARFALPEGKLGLMPGYGGTQRLPRLVGRGRALEMMYTGEMIDATTALAIGLVNHVTTPAELLPKALGILDKANALSPLSHRMVNDAVCGGLEHPEKGYAIEAKHFANIMVSEDGREGVQAFLQKRKPNFSGK